MLRRAFTSLGSKSVDYCPCRTIDAPGRVSWGTSTLSCAWLGMPFSQTAFDAATRDLATAALNTAWTAICLARTPPEHHRAAMVLAITDALVAGERDFMRLQQIAIDAFGVDHLPKAVDRRHSIRLVSTTDGDRSLGLDGLREK